MKPSLHHVSVFVFFMSVCSVAISNEIAVSAELGSEKIVGIWVAPSPIRLEGLNASCQLVVSGKTVNGKTVDLTRRSIFEVDDSSPFRISRTGVLHSEHPGATSLTVKVGDHSVSVPVEVVEDQIPIEFKNDVVPLLNKFGCNSSGCHGKAEGQNGFKLSVFGFDPNADFESLLQSAKGRRINLSAPERSLVLTKASGAVPHGGGIRIPPGSREYRIFEKWIADGAPFGDGSRGLEAIRIEPQERILDFKDQQQLRVEAVYNDGLIIDVTEISNFQSNNEAVSTVSESGLVQAGSSPGNAAIMVGFHEKFATFLTLVPESTTVENFPDSDGANYIDRLINRRLKKLNIAPSNKSLDHEYCRRVFVDIIGTLPTAAEARSFIEDPQPNKRLELVEQLLRRAEYSEYWALKWSDILRVDRQTLGHKSAYAFYRWIRESLRSNKRFDSFASDLVTARGPITKSPQGNFFKALQKSGEIAGAVSQVFLGVRIACAECHHHPFDRWSQTDYYGMAGYFHNMKRASTAAGESIEVDGEGEVKHPRTGQRVFAHPLGSAQPTTAAKGDPRFDLARWLTDARNPFFAKTVVNRYWAHFLGRGLVEPVDDFRSTNPATNPELLDALATDFVRSGYDLHHLIRTITASDAYQRSASPNQTNLRDQQNYSRFAFKSLDAEVLMDAVCDVTGTVEKFRGNPVGTRAIQLWDSATDHYFLNLFGRPKRKSACDCERVSEPNVAQVLHVLNSPEIQNKISHAGGRVTRLNLSVENDASLVDEMYLTFFSRLPNETEKATAVTHLQRTSNRQEAAEDLAWSMLNSLEFMFNH